MAKSFKITISSSGDEVEIGDFKGTVGSECTQISEAFRRQGKVLKDEKNDDYYKGPGVRINGKVG